MVTKQDIERFLMNKSIAVIGASTNKKKFGNIVMRHLIRHGYKVFPVNPASTEVEGLKCFPSVQDLPEDIAAAVFITKPEVTKKITEDILQENHIKNIWMQQGAENNMAIQLALEKGLNVIHGECILMFQKFPGFPHNIHGFIKKIGGKYPK